MRDRDYDDDPPFHVKLDRVLIRCLQIFGISSFLGLLGLLWLMGDSAGGFLCLLVLGFIFFFGTTVIFVVRL